MKVLILMLLVGLMGLLGCRTVKRTVKDRAELERKAEMDAVAVRSGTKERDIVRYWPDGRVYEFEQLRERVDEAELRKLEMQEKAVIKRDEAVKEREPTKFWLRFWVYAGIILVSIAAVWVYKLFKN